VLTKKPAEEFPVAEVTAPPSAAEERAAMLASGEGVIVESWSATEDPSSVGVTGDVVWDDATQRGYMRFAGLPANDPGQEQYQLWIFDATRDDRFPVDGGVFDIPAAGGEVVVPITARLPVRQAALFAVTVERPGGVVVSSRERIVALAQVATG
jgi:anti-sigma-K factor RskA